MKLVSDVIIRPVISEKSLKDAGNGRYTFLVHKSANKHAVKSAIETLFNVHVTGVFTQILKGSRVTRTRFGMKSKGFTKKKARVQLKKGEKIELFEEEKK